MHELIYKEEIVNHVILLITEYDDVQTVWFSFLFYLQEPLVSPFWIHPGAQLGIMFKNVKQLK